MEPDASPEAVRDAYRRAARAHHPDRHGVAASARMAEVNDAWRVLGDAARRREYDLTLQQPATKLETGSGWSPASAESAFTPLARDNDPARFPWRFLGGLGVLGLAFVVFGVVTAPDPKPPTVDNVLEPGDCVAIQANGDAAERLCTDPHDAVVELLVSTGEPCPGDSEPHRDELGLGTACVRRI